MWPDLITLPLWGVGVGIIVCILKRNPKWIYFNSSLHGQMVAMLADEIFRCIFLHEKGWILIKISLKCVSKCLIDNNQALV